MRIRNTLLIASTFFCVLGVAADAQEKRRPNVVVILTDDQGSVDLNCYGATDLATPNLDQLAQSGIRWTQFYAGAPVCSPSRASLLTGRTPQSAGVPGNVSSQPGFGGMPADQFTLAELFSQAGYATGHVGKWHLGYTPATMPNGQGFDESFGHMGGCIDNYSHFFYWNGPNRHDLWRNGQEIWADGKYFPDLMTEEAIRFVQTERDRPFFLYWAINVPHYPLQATAHWRNYYKDLPSPRSMYAAFVSTMDERIGHLLSELDRLKIQDDTIIVFQSDHGHSTEQRTFGGGGSAGPYRGAKFSLFEGGIRVPAMISWPGKIPAGETRDQVAVSMDWFPTLANLCEIQLPDRKIDGINLSRVIMDDAPSPHDVIHWESGGSANKRQWAVRKGKWKLIGHPNDTSIFGQKPQLPDRFLVNLEEDPSEQQNLAADHPDIVEDLVKLHTQWVKQVKD